MPQHPPADGAPEQPEHDHGKKQGNWGEKLVLALVVLTILVPIVVSLFAR